MQHLPPEGMTVGALHIGLQTWTQAQSGVLISLSPACGETENAVWLMDAGWHTWCEQTLGTTDVALVDVALLDALAEWALSPLLTESQCHILRQNTPPRPCSYLSGQSGVFFTWQQEQVTFQAVLFGNMDAWFKHLYEMIPPRSEPVGELPPLQCALYGGVCELPASALLRIAPGEGIFMSPFGDVRAGHFVVFPVQDRAAYVQLNGDNTMQFTALDADPENAPVVAPELRNTTQTMSIDLDALPQKLLVEVGQVTLTLGSLRSLRVGDSVAVNTAFSPEVTLKLNGQAIGKGALIGCGDRFLVQIRQWYLAAQH